jgi:hypothetical protein
MNINSIASSNSQAHAVGQNANVIDKYKNNDEKKSEAKSLATAKSDTLELSAEALKFQPIKKKIEEGFYDKPEIIRQVAEKIDDELRAE